MKLSLATLLLPVTVVFGYDVWPLPTSYSTGTSALSISPSLTFTLEDGTSSNGVLTGAFDRYSAAIVGGLGCGDTRSLLSDSDFPKSSSEVEACTVSVANGREAPELSYETDESYIIDIGEDGKVRMFSKYSICVTCPPTPTLHAT